MLSQSLDTLATYPSHPYQNVCAFNKGNNLLYRMFYPLLRISTKQNEGHLKSNNIQKKFPAIHNTFVVIGDLKNKERNSRIGDF